MTLPPALHHPLLWQGSRRHDRIPTLPTGHGRLDRALPGGGWPLGALTELLVPRDGVGELSLLLPTLARVTREGGWAVLVDPPWTPYPPAIHGQGIDLERLVMVSTRDAKASLWACEQALRGVRGGVVLSWLRGRRHQAGFAHLRRLQLAARSGRKGAFLFRGPEAAGQSTPAALRLHLEADERDLRLTLLKCRGTHQGVRVRLRRAHGAPRPAPVAHPENRPGNHPGNHPGNRPGNRPEQRPEKRASVRPGPLPDSGPGARPGAGCAGPDLQAPIPPAGRA